ncbi:MAG: homoserine kinase [Oxalobacter sp.]|nr:homoserine kinase [Oxalobacter sp.]
MAVFTSVTLEDLKPLLAGFNLQPVIDIRGISSGIENSNFFIVTKDEEYVLTLFEKLTHDELPFYLNLMHHLAEKGVKVPAPIADKAGNILHTLCGKPACIVTKLAGDWIRNPKPIHCAQVGAMMGKMHVAAKDYPMSLPNPRGMSWWIQVVPQILPYIPEDAGKLLQSELSFQKEFQQSSPYALLPKGPVHADLFRNNVMFDGDRLTGFFDFYFAGNDIWLFDVAVAINDWCIDLETGVLDMLRVRAFLDAYQAERPFTETESMAWQATLRSAALRFWLSRLYDFYMPRKAELLKPHDPKHFERILKLRIADPAPQLTL